MTKPAHIASRWLVLLIALAAIAPAHAAAKFGVYQGAGCDGTGRMGHFTSWLGRDPDVVLEFLSWQVLEEGSTWAVRCWQKAGRKDVVFSMPMLPGGNRATLADGAAGKFDDLFSRYGAELVKTGYANSVIRIGWEFNYNWYAWAASKDP